MGAAIAAAILAAAAPAPARPNIRLAFFTVYPSALGSKLDNLPSFAGHCAVCHFDAAGGGAKNFYGDALANSGKNLNKDTGRIQAVEAVANLDSDRDGYTTLTEITAAGYSNTPTFPGLSSANVGNVTGVPTLEVSPYVTPTTVVDNTPPEVTVLAPNGGGSLTANAPFSVTWSATDASGIAGIHIYQSIDGGATYTPVALGLENTGSYPWVPANRPTTAALIRVVAIDGATNSAADASDAVFAIVSPPGGLVRTTLRDFDMPGSQPFEGGPEPALSTCIQCHGNYAAAVEPYHNWRGSMMALASRDPLFEANLTIANQDAPDSGDICLRCHISGGWLQGRSVPTSGAAMLESDKVGVSCDLCHRMVDPVYLAGNKADGMVSTCQDCHMRDVSGQGCNPALNPGVPVRADLPLHDMTGGSTWMPLRMAELYPEQVDAAAAQASAARAAAMLGKAADLATWLEGGRLVVRVTNQTGHKLPTGYPEGRRIWLNAKFFRSSWSSSATRTPPTPRGRRSTNCGTRTASARR